MSEESGNIEKVETIDELDFNELRQVAERSMQKMHRQVDGLTAENIETLLDYFFRPEKLENWIGSTEYQRAALYLSQNEESIKGTLRYRIDEGVAEIQALYIDPDYQREGVATRLLDRAHRDIEDLDEVNVDEVRADVFEGNYPSIKLLTQKHGYNKDSRESDVFPDVDAVVMKHNL